MNILHKKLDSTIFEEYMLETCQGLYFLDSSPESKVAIDLRSIQTGGRCQRENLSRNYLRGNGPGYDRGLLMLRCTGNVL